MNEPLFSIGSYAAETGLTVSALRFYAETGLLSPDHVDSRTGYRYYSSSSIETARLVSRLRAAGTPLEVIRLVIDSEPAQAALALEELAAEREADGARAGELMRRIAASLRRPTGPQPEVSLDAREFAAALRSAMGFVDRAEPFDRVTVVADADLSVQVVATDRFRLSAHRLSDAFASGGSGRASVHRDDVPAVMDWLSSASSSAEMSMAERMLTITAPGAEPLQVTSHRDWLPDHRSLLAPLPDAVVWAELDRDRSLAALAGHADTVTVAVSDGIALLDRQPIGVAQPTRGEVDGIVVTAELLSASLCALPGPTAVLAWHDPRRPVQVLTPLLPHWRTVLMPARPEST